MSDWFRCDKCGDEKRVLVPSYKRRLEANCQCGGVYWRV